MELLKVEFVVPLPCNAPEQVIKDAIRHLLSQSLDLGGDLPSEYDWCERVMFSKAED